MSAPLLDPVTHWLAHPNAVLPPEGVRILRAVIDGQAVFFALRDLADKIQRRHSRGLFYEPDELEMIRAHFPTGGVFCDIGANVGNHTLFATRFLGAKRAIVFEPNPAAYELLVLNVIFNDLLDHVDLSHLGMGVSDVANGKMGLTTPERNLGATRLVAETGEISVAPGDTLLGDQRIDFIKIDVEGMEISVLNGLTNTVRANRPPIFLELEHENRPLLNDWMARHGYAIAVEGRQFRHNGNLMLSPQP